MNGVGAYRAQTLDRRRRHDGGVHGPLLHRYRHEFDQPTLVVELEAVGDDLDPTVRPSQASYKLPADHLSNHRESGQVDEPAVGREGASGDAVPREPQIVAFTECLVALGVRRSDAIEKGPGVPLGRR
jgi:hypothetical protein